MDYSFFNKGLTEASDHSEEHSLGTGQLDGSKLTEVELKASLRLQEQSGGKTQVQSKNPSEETSATVLLDDRRGDTVMDGVNNGNNVISSTDHDVNPSNSKKGFLETRKDNIVCMQVVGKLLDRVDGSTNLLKVGTFGEDGFGNLDESKQGTYPDKDSGVHSGLTDSPARPTLNIPDETALSRNIPCLEKILEEQIQTDVDTNEKEKRSEEENQTKEDPKDREDLLGDKKSDKESQPVATGQLRAAFFTSRLRSRPSKGVAGCGSGGVVAKAANNGRPIPNPAHQGENTGAKGPVLPVASIAERLKAINQIEVSEGQFYGNKADIFNYVNNIGKATENSGVFLQKYSTIFGHEQKRNHFIRGSDYEILVKFVETKDVYLCRSLITGYKFVTKLVPLVEEEVSGPSGQQPRHTYVLQRQQQVDLVVAHQDSCPWNGLAVIYGLMKRKLRGRYYGEIFMEYCEGDTLLQNKDLLAATNIGSYLAFAEKLLDIVKYLHDHDIVHGDIKGENVGYRRNGPALIDFEAAKHPRYKLSSRGTYQYLPYWFHQCYQPGNENLLKTLDLWGVGLILLMIRYKEILYGKELVNVRFCDTCTPTGQLGACRHVKDKFLKLIQSQPKLVNRYLPPMVGGHLQRRLVSLIRCLLTTGGPETQFTAEEALDLLTEDKIAVHILMDDVQVIKPITVAKNTRMKMFICNKNLEELIKRPDFCKGFWLSTNDGKRTNVDLNETLTESCILHINSALPNKK